MITKESVARRFVSDDLDEFFDLLRKKRGEASHSSRRHKKEVEFQAIAWAEGPDKTGCAVSGPATEEIEFSLERDKRGYLLEISVGDLTEENLKTMNRALRLMVKRFKASKPDGFTTKHLNGIYLWAPNGEDPTPVFDEAIKIGQMSRRFVSLCKKHGISAQKFPKI